MQATLALPSVSNTVWTGSGTFTDSFKDARTRMNGFVYVAFGEKFITEAIDSAASARRTNPGVPICLISDSRTHRAEFEIQIYAERHNPVIRGKLEMFNSPFEKTLFLDTDTEICGDLSEVFELLNRFEILFQQSSGGYHYKLEGVPHAFPEPNTGVIGFRKSPRITNFAQVWASYFDRYVDVMGREWDQRSFRHAIYLSELRFSVLPPEYNFMTYFPQYAMTPMKIVHGRPRADCRNLQTLMDRETGPRAYVPRIGCIGHYNQVSLLALFRTLINTSKVLAQEIGKRSLKGGGLYPLAQSLAKRLRRFSSSG